MILSPQDFYCFLGILLQLKHKKGSKSLCSLCSLNTTCAVTAKIQQMKKLNTFHLVFFEKSNYFGFIFIVEYVIISTYT